MPPSSKTVSDTFLIRHRGLAFLLANAAFVLLTLWGASVWNVPIWRPLYLCLLFALCSGPVLLLRSFNDRYILLAMFMVEYFVMYGALDFQSVLLGQPLSTDADFATPAEIAILIGAFAVFGGYLVATSSIETARAPRAIRDWPRRTVLLVGLGLTAAWGVAYFYFRLVTVTVNGNHATAVAFEQMGPMLTFIVMLGHLVGALGILLLAYGYARYRTLTWLLCVLAVLGLQIFLGFFGDSKGIPLLAAALVVLTRTLVDNRLPRIWILSCVCGTIVLWPIFQAYRGDVVAERGLNHAQALQNLDKVIQIVVGNRERVSEGPPGTRAQTILERTSLKANMELLFNRVPSDTPFQHGQTLVPLVFAFVPRLVWEDKPAAETQLLFNHLVIRGEGDTEVSVSQLGELYWNFGWPGLVVGMALFGALLGFIGAKSNLADAMSATRLMVMMATVYTLCLEFEGAIAVQYVVWLRSIAAVGILHLVLSRRSGQTAAPAHWPREASSARQEPARPVRFPNVLRY